MRPLTSTNLLIGLVSTAIVVTLTWQSRHYNGDNNDSNNTLCDERQGECRDRNLAMDMRRHLAQMTTEAAGMLPRQLRSSSSAHHPHHHYNQHQQQRRRHLQAEEEREAHEVIGDSDSADRASQDGLSYDWTDVNASYVMYKDKKLFYPPGYEDVHVLGHGGQGTVFKAVKVQKFWYKHHYYGQPDSWDQAEIRTTEVLLKRNIMMAENQARLAAKMNHDNIVRQYDAFAWHDDIWTETEWIEGRSFKALIAEVAKENIKYCPYFLADAMLQLARGFHHMHTVAKVLHIDNHAPNFMLTSEGVVKIIDFGLSEDMHGDVNFQFAHETWPWFPASPERTRRLKYGTADDMYALGFYLVALSTADYRMTWAHDDYVIEILDYDHAVSLMNDISPELGDMAARLLQENSTARPTAAHAITLFEKIKVKLDPFKCCEHRYACKATVE